MRDWTMGPEAAKGGVSPKELAPLSTRVVSRARNSTTTSWLSAPTEIKANTVSVDRLWW